MAWIRYLKLAAHLDGVHRVSNPYQEILFDAAKNNGLVDVRNEAMIQKLLRTGRYEIALERYGVRFDAQGVQFIDEDAPPSKTKSKA